MIIEFLFRMQILEIFIGDGCILWMYLMPLNYTPQNGSNSKLHICIVYHNNNSEARKKTKLYISEFMKIR